MESGSGKKTGNLTIENGKVKEQELPKGYIAIAPPGPNREQRRKAQAAYRGWAKSNLGHRPPARKPKPGERKDNHRARRHQARFQKRVDAMVALFEEMLKNQGVNLDEYKKEEDAA
jgi:hypothetical protein